MRRARCVENKERRRGEGESKGEQVAVLAMSHLTKFHITA